MEEFNNAFKTFIEAVKTKDFITFKKFFSAKYPFHATLPNGVTYNKVDSFLESQLNYFESDQGRFDYQLLKTQKLNECYHAYIKAVYTDKNQNNQSSSKDLLISFIFVKNDNNWILVFDQNTLVSEK